MDSSKYLLEPKGVSQIHSKENPLAQVIRSKLIQDFNLLDHLQGLIINDPKYNMNDIKDPKKLTRLMIEDPLQLVRFDFNPVRNINVSSNDRERNCLKNRYVKYPPLNMWAQWILESLFFKNMILYLIIINIIVFGVLADVSSQPGMKYTILTIMLVIIDWSILSVLVCEIILRWLQDFVKFWSSGWNVFDLIVLIISIIPEVINQTHLKISIELYFLKVFRILRVLRSLKRMRKFHQVRLLLLAMTKALKAMTFILMLVLLFAYVFAIVGVSLFRIYTESGNPGREYKFAFVNILHTLQTLFQLFTLDHWHALLIDIWKVDEVDKIASGIYIIFWILIGSFIFRNIIVGIMVSNFQTIRNDLSAQVQQLEDQRKAEQFKLQIMQRRMSQSLTFTKADGAMESEFSAPSEINIKGSSHNSYSSDISFKPTGKDWESYVRINIKLMKFNPTREKVIWPRDSLFRYYELLEQLQYNLEERKTLQFLAAQALMNIHDI
ncbi:cation channel sperm-associated protein 2 isoform X1 [Amblyraja radiata]|uniref:cation channel sperm-associated protein 2 isoform X1 n=1 Tax=Amblyraja radiata TaxID=386614 RepID=UPI0014030FC0|nr:cation channel sperm-associated protein 2 isoform X1 [Amblyraja radiata]XP_032906081.1 cation channel sperm-associated protein 2 isoform X1 [Amblyraja radiata]XP_032906082.1 cation channel sperm-associated protein 2 isoform X1 [Amblyraja radiata]XP_032906083.1 cation channel sperm-associated protein 2 isoform X1 [Amblyraja radiata]